MLFVDYKRSYFLNSVSREIFLDLDPIATSELTNRQYPLRLQPPHYYLRGETKLKILTFWFSMCKQSEIFTKNSTLLLPSFLNCSASLSVYGRWLRRMKTMNGEMN
ncbi:Uncharacterized protein Rs2_05901 [Raphanus sativus]|nr:Uncharacterized protein Rs2_05901 [Raphanus sativus]